MTRPSTPPDQSVQIRCPRLGHQINFDYCLQEDMGRPCFKILHCWYPYFKVEEFLSQELSEQVFSDIIDKPVKPKILSLMQTVQDVQKRKKKD